MRPRRVPARARRRRLRDRRRLQRRQRAARRVSGRDEGRRVRRRRTDVGVTRRGCQVRRRLRRRHGEWRGEDYVNLCRETVAPRGRRVAINGGAWKWIRALTGWQRDDDRLILTRQNGAELTKIVETLGGKPTPVIDSKWNLDEAGVAGRSSGSSRDAREGK